MTASAPEGNAGRLVEQIDTALRSRGTPERAEHEKAYLRSELEHYGTSVPAIRSVAKEVASHHPGLSRDDLLALVDALWAAPVHERRMVAVELLDIYHGRLHGEDLVLLERLLRESRTWALVDPLAASVVGRGCRWCPASARSFARYRCASGGRSGLTTRSSTFVITCGGLRCRRPGKMSS